MNTVRELSNLSVGKVLSVELSEGPYRQEVAVQVRLMASTTPTDLLIHTLTAEAQDKSWRARWHRFKAGDLAPISDMLLCKDLVDAHRKNLMKDEQGIYGGILKRRRDNQLSGLLSGNFSVANASNIVVVSSNTAARIELEINGQLSNYKTRERIMRETGIMIMAVIDKEWDRVTFYYSGIAERAEVTIRDMKASNKGSGPDVSDILRAYQVGHAPAF